MSDRSITDHINELVAEEEKLRNAGAADPDSARRLKQVEVHLDQCWDLLRQRRAKREFGQDPDDATLRDPKTVEGYKG